MRHQKTNRKFGRETAPRKALLKNLLNSLVLYEKIKTTQAKAKEIKPLMERVITRTKEDTLHNRRQIMTKVTTQNAVKKLFEVLGPKYKDRMGGYLRIINLEQRKGDAAKMAVIEFV
jgi:large subunit ribosomal protein L17